MSLSTRRRLPRGGIQALLGSQQLELGAEGVEQFGKGEGLGVWRDLAVFQARDVQQVADQLSAERSELSMCCTNCRASSFMPSACCDKAAETAARFSGASGHG